MTRCLISISVVSLVFAGVANASVQQNDAELEFLGGFIQEDGSGHIGTDMETWFVSGGLGYFVSDNLQVMGSGFGFWTDVDNTSYAKPTYTETRFSYDIDVFGIGGKARWFFLPKNQWVPYAGAHLYYAHADIEITTKPVTGLPTKQRLRPDGVLWGPLIGLRFELNATNDFFAEYQYHVWDGDIGREMEDGHAIFLGIVHQFK